MAAQDNVALVWSLLDLYNNRQSDPAWLDKSVAAFAADCEVVDAASGTTFRSPEGYKRFIRFFVENFPDGRGKLGTEFATEDWVVLETTWWWTNTAPLSLPSEALPARGHAGGVPMCHVLQIRHGKIVSLHCYYDLTTLLQYFGLAPARSQAM